MCLEPDIPLTRVALFATGRRPFRHHPSRAFRSRFPRNPGVSVRCAANTGASRMASTAALHG